MEKKKIIIDCDPGYDDAVALLLAAGNPNIDVLAITTVAGNQTIDKVLDTSIAVEKLLEGVLIPKEIFEIPDVYPYRIDWPIELDLCNDTNVYLGNQFHEISLLNSAIRMVECDEKSEIHFKVETEEFYEEIKLTIDNNGYYFTHCSGDLLNIHIKKRECSLIDFFKENPPRVKFVDQSTLEGNYYVTLLQK